MDLRATLDYLEEFCVAELQEVAWLQEEPRGGVTRKLGPAHSQARLIQKRFRAAKGERLANIRARISLHSVDKSIETACCAPHAEAYREALVVI